MDAYEKFKMLTEENKEIILRMIEQLTDDQSLHQLLLDWRQTICNTD